MTASPAIRLRSDPGAERLVARPARAPMPRRHRILLLLAFEIMVFGFAQAQFHPVRRGILIEVTTTPNHVVT